MLRFPSDSWEIVISAFDGIAICLDSILIIGALSLFFLALRTEHIIIVHAHDPGSQLGMAAITSLYSKKSVSHIPKGS